MNAQQQAPQVATGTVSGAVIDADGEGIAGAQVRLAFSASSLNLQAKTDAGGRFRITNIAPQPFTISATASGFGSATVSGTLQAGQDIELSPITLSAAANVEVEVGPLSQVELAEQQIHMEETQRLIGVVPNFYVSYNWKAAPLTPRQKLELATKTAIDPVTLGVVTAFTAYDQGTNHFEAYGPGPSGFGKRFGANFADSTIGTFAGGYLMPVIFHQDPRYFYKGSGSVFSRTMYALSTAFICRGDNGKWQPNYSGLAGNLTAGAASNLYYPSNDRSGVSLTFENALIGIVSSGVGDVFQEFFSHRFTRHAPATSPAVPAPSNR